MLRPHPDTSPNLDTSRAGFTLIEIAVVLVILALAYGFVTPAFSNFVAATRLESAARELAMALKEARSTAIVTGMELRFTFDPGVRGWRFADRRNAVDDRVSLEVETAPAARNSDGSVWIGFYPDGRSTGGRIVLRSGERRRSVDVHWLTGHVSQTAK